MREMHISEIYALLNWNESPENQEKGMESASRLEDVAPLILPLSENAGKPVWENCARVLSAMPDDRLAGHMPALLEWLQDINWPGALLVCNRLKRFCGKELIAAVEDAVAAARKMAGEDGLMWLDYLSELLDNKSLAVGLSESTLQLLQTHYRNWAAWYKE